MRPESYDTKQDTKAEQDTIYECLACGTIFKRVDGEYRYGYMVCPSCWYEEVIGIDDLIELSAQMGVQIASA